MKLILYVVSCMFLCVYFNVVEAMNTTICSYRASNSSSKLQKKRLRNENDPCSLDHHKKACLENGKIFYDAETIAAEQLLSLCRSEIVKQGTTLKHDSVEVLRARSKFLASVKNVLMWRQSRTITYKRAFAVGMNMERCKRELHILEHEMNALESNMERSKREAITYFFQLKKAQSKEKL